jgi:uncharacterized cupin superfamily protein
VAAPNLFDPEFEPHDGPDGFGGLRARLGRQAGARQLGASLYELPPGLAAWPYHAHLANEELLIVMRGRPALRTPSGWRELAEGEVVAFPAGEEGAHQVLNPTDQPVRVLMVSTMEEPEVAIYPDSRKYGLFDRAPGSAGKGLTVFVRGDAQVGYWDGEPPPSFP